MIDRGLHIDRNEVAKERKKNTHTHTHTHTHTLKLLYYALDGLHKVKKYGGFLGSYSM